MWGTSGYKPCTLVNLRDSLYFVLLGPWVSSYLILFQQGTHIFIVFKTITPDQGMTSHSSLSATCPAATSLGRVQTSVFVAGVWLGLARSLGFM